MKLTIVLDSENFTAQVIADRDPETSKEVRQVVALMQQNLPPLAERLAAMHDQLNKAERAAEEGSSQEGPAETEPAEVEISQR